MPLSPAASFWIASPVRTPGIRSFDGTTMKRSFFTAGIDAAGRYFLIHSIVLSAGLEAMELITMASGFAAMIASQLTSPLCF